MASDIAIAVIPARFASVRFPGKPLALIAGKPMVQWVVEQTKKAKVFERVLVATDDRRIAAVVEGFGGEVVMTKSTLPSGTDRVAAAVKGIQAEWIMNVQGDEPLIDPRLLTRLVTEARRTRVPSIFTAAERIDDASVLEDPNAVKVVTTAAGRALYFSRSPIPFLGRAETKRFAPLKHVGIYLYHREALSRFVSAKPSLLEQTEKLEQLRAFELGLPIEVVESGYHPINVDHPDDIARVEKALAEGRKGRKC